MQNNFLDVQSNAVDVTALEGVKSRTLMDAFAQAFNNPDFLWLIAAPSLLVVVILFTAVLSLWLKHKKQAQEVFNPEEKDETEKLFESLKDKEDKTEENITSPKPGISVALKKTRSSFMESLGQLFGRNTPVLDASLKDQVHEILYRADLGVQAADDLVKEIETQFKGSKEDIGLELIKNSLIQKIETYFVNNEAFEINAEQIRSKKPFVIMVAGVNGVGKTTSIAKLAKKFKDEYSLNVLLAAADTFRAAAIDQLKVWGDRVGCEVIAHQSGSDPAAVVYDAVKAAKSRDADVLIIDTAGRLHNKKELMDELAKMHRIIQREIPSAPHEVFLVVDATTGQNAMQQAKVFKELIKVTGLIATKLDGTAKGGILLAIHNALQIPIKYVGVGESMNDLIDFDAKEFSKALFE